jgi:small subunit ribosomal protein S8e
MLWQGRSVRQSTGGRYRPYRGKRRAEIGSAPTDTHIGEERMRIVKTFGGNRKIRVVRTSIASVADPKSGTMKRAKIETVEQNGANPNYVRRNLLTKGAIIRTEIGRARIVSRPGQDGVINAVLLQ